MFIFKKKYRKVQFWKYLQDSIFLLNDGFIENILSFIKLYN